MSTAGSASALEVMRDALGGDKVSDDVTGYSVDGLSPTAVAFPENVDDVCVALQAATAEGLSVAPWGGGTRVGLGNSVRRLDVALVLTRLDSVVQHNAADLTVTVEAGITLSRFQDALSAEGQFLALDPPLPQRATIGGTLAAGTAGPLTWHYGNPRDLVIGMKVVQADGKLTKSGGQVVKNVSGYDMARLHVGGIGTLGVIAEVSFKLTPLPRAEATLLAAFGSAEECHAAAGDVFGSHVVPLALNGFDASVGRRAQVTDRENGHLLAVRLGGRPRTIQRQLGECRDICGRHAALSVDELGAGGAPLLWRRLADFGWDEDTGAAVLVRASVLPSRTGELAKALSGVSTSDVEGPAVLAYPGYGTVVACWFSDGVSLSGNAALGVVGRARDAVRAGDGRMTVERCPNAAKSELDVWGDVGDSIAIMRRLKEQYDPTGTINPGRFVGGI